MGDKGNEIRMNVWLRCDGSETGVEQKESELWEVM